MAKTPLPHHSANANGPLPELYAFRHPLNKRQACMTALAGLVLAHGIERKGEKRRKKHPVVKTGNYYRNSGNLTLRTLP